MSSRADIPFNLQLDGVVGQTLKDILLVPRGEGIIAWKIAVGEGMMANMVTLRGGFVGR